MSTASGPQDAVLVVERERRWWLDSLRRYRIVVDDVEVARLANGESCTVPITSGQHAVRARIDWTGSQVQAISPGPGETVTLVVGWRGNLFSARGYLHLDPVVGGAEPQG